MKTLISVVIPTYQRRDKLKITIDSVLSQTYDNYEILIMDDGSTDGTKEMVNSYNDPRIFYNWQENTGGPANPRNNGIKISRGDWIAFLDDDDTWEKNKLAEICGQIHKNNDFIYHDYSLILENKYPNKKIIKSSNLRSPIFNNLLINGNIIGLSTVVVRKELLLKIDGFNEDVNMAPCADYNAWLRIAQLTEKFFYLPKNLGYYKVDKYNMSNQDMTISKRLAIKEFSKFLTYKQKFRIEAKLNYQSGSFNFTKKNHKNAINLFLSALKYGDLLIKLKSLVRLTQVSIMKVIDNIIKTVFN